MDRKIFTYSIYTGLIASALFAWFLGPLTEWLWNITSTSASSAISDLQNGVFKSAALGKRDWVSVVLFFCFLSFFFLVLTGLTIFQYLIVNPENYISSSLRSNSNKLEKWTKKLSKFNLIVVASSFIPYFLVLFVVFVDLQLNTSFDQRMNALGPYMTLEQEKKFKSSWALMKQRVDYLKINSEMEEIATRAKIVLPKNLYD